MVLDEQSGLWAAIARRQVSSARGDATLDLDASLDFSSGQSGTALVRLSRPGPAIAVTTTTEQ